MNSEIFRFAIVRPPMPAPPAKVNENTLFLESGKSEFIDILVKARSKGTRAEIFKHAQGYIKSPGLLTSSAVDKPYLDFSNALKQAPAEGFEAYTKEAFQSAFNTSATQLYSSQPFTDLFKRVSESIVVAAMRSEIDSGKRAFLVTLIRSIKVIQDMAEGRPLKYSGYSKTKIILPSGLFPLPSENAGLSGQRKEEKEKQDKAIEEANKKVKALRTELNGYNSSIQELLNTYELQADPDQEPVIERRTTAQPVKTGFYLSESASRTLSGTTKKNLSAFGISDTHVNVARAVSALENKSYKVASELYSGDNLTSHMAKIGNLLFPVHGNGTLVLNGDLEVAMVPGRCVSTITPGNTATGESPIPYGHGKARVLGIADLLIVEQELLRYQLGEIAHIENVLKSELRERVHRVTKTTTEEITTETEETETKEKDLTSTERFELKTETQEVINENTSKDAGLTINASYGFVDVTANFNYTNTEALTNSRTSASNFARDTTSRAVNKIEKKTLTRLMRKTVEEIRETNTHKFDNTAPGSENISGVYRFVDKIYKGQIINYGKRLMLEFTVPEPAAFLRYALTGRPAPNISVDKPDPPGFCTNGGQNFVPLKVQDIDRVSYLYWASRYGATDVIPPPPYTQVVSSAVTSNFQEMQKLGDNDYLNSKSISIDTPEGYRPLRAKVLHDEINLENDDPAYIKILIDNKAIGNGDQAEFYLSPGNWKNIAVAVNTLNKALFGVVINVFCILTDEKYQEWQLKVFTAIMNAYNDQKSRYDNAVQVEKNRAEFSGVSGSNPAINRETEKVELKKSCLSLLTGQRFELFNAMTRNVAPQGYPEIDFVEAEAEGAYIGYYEQAFEWNNITYVFYPYFWGKKEEWTTQALLSDDDPLFTKFLQAGSARVQVPVRIGFETSVLNYLSGLDKPWEGEGILINSVDGEPDQTYVSVLEELKTQLGNDTVIGPGKISVTQDASAVTGSATEFTLADENRRIIIGGVTYIIKKVHSETSFDLATGYQGADAQDIGYALGAILVGEPWEIKLPTSLVKLSDDNTDVGL